MSIANRIMGMKQQVKKTEVTKPQVTKQLAIANKPESKQAPKQKTLGPAQLAAIAAISGQAEADRIQALLAGGQAQLAGANKPEAVKHLTDVLAPEYSLVAEFITPDEKPSRSKLESDIANWALRNPEVLR